MRREQRPEVLVVGAGPVGSTAAFHLAERGIAVQILDARFERDDAPFSVLLYPDTLRRMRSLELEDPRLGPTLRLGGVALYDGGERRGVLRFDAGDGCDGPLVVTYEAIERLLSERLEEKHVPVAWQRCVCAVRTDHEDVILKVGELDRETYGYAIMHLEEVLEGTHETRAGWVVATDGPESSTRLELDLPIDPTGDEAIYAALELASEGPAADEMRIVLDGHATATYWPLPGGGHRYTFRLADAGGYRERLRTVEPEPTVRHLVHLLRERHRWFTADPDDLTWARVERFQPGIARRIGEGRVLLAGEAAHRLEPLASRALNEGLLEAERIGENLAGVIEGVLSPSDLRTYAADVRAGLDTLAAPERCFEPNDRADPWVAENVRRIAPLLPADGRDLDRLLGDLGLPRRKAA